MGNLIGQVSGSSAVSGTVSGENSLSGQLSAGIKDITEVIQYDTIYDLPNRGASTTLYMIQSENACYRWDESGSKYFCIGRDYQEIENILGGTL
jgi:hypothetical protein